MILSFAWTTPAVVLGKKDTTRRDWSPKTIAMARKIMAQGGTFDAWDKSPRFGGKPIGTVRILELIENEDSKMLAESEWEREGFHVLQALNARIGKRGAIEVWQFWKHDNETPQTVLRFEVLSLNAYGNALDYNWARELKYAGGPIALETAINAWSGGTVR
jgi:hypothetical protein